jgi:hypothetical protein
MVPLCAVIYMINLFVRSSHGGVADTERPHVSDITFELARVKRTLS